jgi:hypothetical protein
MTDAERDMELIERVVRERCAQDWDLALHLDPEAAMCVAGLLQLAMRHPEIPPSVRKIARLLVDGILERFRETKLDAHAEMLLAGEKP